MTYPTWAPLINGKDTSLDQNPGTFPNMYEALFDRFQLLTFTQLTKSVSVNFQNAEVQTVINFMGMVVPAGSQALAMRPEGQRDWIPIEVFAYPNAPLNPDDIVIWEGTQYRVMFKQNYKQYGYIHYILNQDYVGTVP